MLKQKVRHIHSGLLAFLFCTVMVCGLLPTTAFAASTETVTRIDGASNVLEMPLCWTEVVHNMGETTVRETNGDLLLSETTTSTLVTKYTSAWKIDKKNGTDSFLTSDSWSVKYAYIGQINGRKVGAVLEFSDPIEVATSYSGNMIIYKDFWSGAWMQGGIKSIDTKISLYYSDNNSPIDLTDSYISLGSLNGPRGIGAWEGVKYNSTGNIQTYLDNSTNLEQKDNETGKWQGKQDSGLTDYVGGATYVRNTVAFKINESSPEFTFSKGYSGSNMWFSYILSPLGAVANSPKKSIIGGDGNESTELSGVHNGDSFTYKISQIMPVLGVTATNRYTSFLFADKLPAEVDYLSAKVTLDAKTLPEANYTISQSGQTLEVAMTDAFLSQNANFSGQTLALEISVKQNDTAGGFYVNQASTTANTLKLNTNSVKVNTDNVGSLTVSKTVKGDGVNTNKAFAFTVKFSDTSVNGTYGDMTIKGGVASFTLKHGESKTATGIPTGVSYTVKEDKTKNWTASFTGETGTITKAGAIAVFTNTYTKSAAPGSSGGTKTGDDSNIVLWILLGGLAIAGTIAVLMLRRKEEESK